MSVQKARRRAKNNPLLRQTRLATETDYFLGVQQAFIPKALLRRQASSALAREVRVTEFLGCVHCAVLPFRASSLERAAGPREASVACAKVIMLHRYYHTIVSTTFKAFCPARVLSHNVERPPAMDSGNNVSKTAAARKQLRSKTRRRIYWFPYR